MEARVIPRTAKIAAVTVQWHSGECILNGNAFVPAIGTHTPIVQVVVAAAKLAAAA
jgi:hypothetical protein